MNENTLKVLAFGEILFDFIGGAEHLGGAPLNFAAHISRLGANAAILSAIGCDDRGERAVKRLLDYGVGCEYILRSPKHLTGIVNVELSGQGQPSYSILENVAYDNIAYSPRQAASILDEGWDAFYFGTLAQRNDVSRECLYDLLDRFSGGVVFCDINLRQNYYSRRIIEKSFGYADIVKINDDELRVLSKLLYDDVIEPERFFGRLACEYGIKLLVVTCGSRGCDVFAESGWFHSDGVEVDVVDTVGAGDAFSAAFLYSYLTGHTLEQSAGIANRLGAAVAGQRGAVPVYELINI